MKTHLVILACAAAGAFCPAQQLAGDVSTVPLASVVGERVFVDAVDGAIWAGAAAWKARFDPQGASFQPCVGAAQRSRAVTLALTGAAVAGKPLAVGGASPELQAGRVLYARGAVVEFYDLRPEGIEQQFELAALPERGELRLRVAVATDLATQRDGAGFRFVDGPVAVRYGAATAIDAAGRALPLVTTWHDGALEIAVPAEFVASAALPLRIDPLIDNPVPVATSTLALTATDVAWDQSLQRWFVSYERSFSGTDHDVYVAVCGPAMQLLSTVTIDYTSEYWTGPRIAVLEAVDTVGVIAQTSAANQPPYGIKARSFTGGGTPVPGPVWSVQGVLNGESGFEPDLGGDAAPAGSPRFLAAWETRGAAINSSTIHYCHLSPDASPWQRRTVSTPIGFVHDVQVSKTRGSGAGNDGWALVFRSDVMPHVDGRLRVAYVDKDGTSRFVGCCASALITDTTTNSGNEFAVSSPTDGDRRFLVVEQRVDPVTGNGRVLGHLLDDQGNVLIGSAVLVAGNVDRRKPVVDCDGCRFAVASTTVWSGTDVDVRLALFAPLGGQLVPQEVLVAAGSLDIERTPAVCAARGSANRYGVAWLHEANGTYTLQAQVWHALAAGGFATRATGCGGLTTTATGWAALGDQFTLHRTPANGVGGFAVGFPTTQPIGPCPGCALGVNGWTVFGSDLTVAVPCDATFVGLQLAFQGFRLDNAPVQCLGALQLGNTLDVVVQ